MNSGDRTEELAYYGDDIPTYRLKDGLEMVSVLDEELATQWIFHLLLTAINECFISRVFV